LVLLSVLRGEDAEPNEVVDAGGDGMYTQVGAEP
jgi:hypothetical protein